MKYLARKYIACKYIVGNFIRLFGPSLVVISLYGLYYKPCNFQDEKKAESPKTTMDNVTGKPWKV